LKLYSAGRFGGDPEVFRVWRGTFLETHSSGFKLTGRFVQSSLSVTEGYQIVRVQNDDVYRHINDVLDMILMGLEGRL